MQSLKQIMFLVLLICFAGGLPSFSQISPVYTFDGDAAGDESGYSVSSAGDVNNDGYDDIIVGLPFNDNAGTDAGRVYVYSGKTGAILYIFTGGSADALFGHSVSGAGDVNNDGYDDVIIGAPLYVDLFSYEGQAYVYSGQTGDILYTFIGEAAYDQFGFSVSGAGDVNNDGYDDVIIGAPFNDDSYFHAGRAYVYSGQDGTNLHIFNPTMGFHELGWSVSSAGDVNNDGYDDVIVGAPRFGGNRGRAYVFSGQTGDDLAILEGLQGGERFGYSVSGAGNVNNDGFDDVIVGAPLADLIFFPPGSGSFENAGRVDVFLGPFLYFLTDFVGNFVDDKFGTSVSLAGDIDNDGYDDILAGGILFGGSGFVRVFSGQTGTILRDYKGDSDLGNEFGFSVSFAGDVNNDGFDDIIVGAHLNDSAGTDAGRSFVYAGSCCIGIRGDVDGNGTDADIGDLTYLTDFIFRGGAIPPCDVEADVNNDGLTATVLDLTFLVDRIFRGGPLPDPC